jgi:hypothetical protein
VDYTLVNHRVDFFTGANVTPVKHGSFAVGPGVQADTLSLIEPAGHSITSVAYTSANVGSTVAGGGSNTVPVFCNGTNWVIG